MYMINKAEKKYQIIPKQMHNQRSYELTGRSIRFEPRLFLMLTIQIQQFKCTTIINTLYAGKILQAELRQYQILNLDLLWSC